MPAARGLARDRERRSRRRKGGGLGQQAVDGNLDVAVGRYRYTGLFAFQIAARGNRLPGLADARDDVKGGTLTPISEKLRSI